MDRVKWIKDFQEKCQLKQEVKKLQGKTLELEIKLLEATIKEERGNV